MDGAKKVRLSGKLVLIEVINMLIREQETYRSDDGLHPVPHSDIERTYYGLDSKALPPSPRHLMAPPEKERYHKYNEADGLEHHPDPRRRRQGTRPVVIWLSAAIVFLIIVAAVVGGVLGSKASSASNIDPTKEFQSSSTYPYN